MMRSIRPPWNKSGNTMRPLLIRWIPVVIPWLKVTRRLDGDGHMVWTRPDLGHLTVTLKRIGKATDTYTRH